MCVHSFVWARGEGLGERQSQEAVPGRSPLDPEFLGRGLLSHPTPDSGSGPSSFLNFLHRSLGFQLLPDVCLLRDFPSFLTPPFPSQLLIQGYSPTRLALTCPTQLQELSLGNRRWYASSQLPSRVSWESWEWGEGTGFICMYYSILHPIMVKVTGFHQPDP